MIQCFEAPDWEDEAAYPNHSGTTPERWAWEFLRRNKGYQAGWQQYADAVMAKAREHPETLIYAAWKLSHTKEAWTEFKNQFATEQETTDAQNQYAATLFHGDDKRLRAFDPPITEHETIAAYKQRVSRHTSYPLDRYLGEKWGLESILNPGTAEPWLLRGAGFKWRLGSGWFMPNVDFRDDLKRHETHPIPNFTKAEHAVHLIKGLGDTLGRPELQTITFNLSLPIDAQVDGVRAHLKDEAQFRSEAGEMEILPQPRYEARMYRNYLRAFDAKQAGAKPAEIVKALLPKEAKANNAAQGYSGSAKVKHWIKQAEFLVETGYRFIPLAANKADKAKRKKLRR
jgi:hypothetical protein